jgi:hypothetical protein
MPIELSPNELMVSISKFKGITHTFPFWSSLPPLVLNLPIFIYGLSLFRELIVYL